MKNYRNKIKAFFMLLAIFASYNKVHSQCTSLANAVPGILLVHQNPNCSNNSGVAYNPGLGLYYGCRAGNSGFPYETWSSTGVPLFNTTTGYDFRGLWWNPTLSTLEGNGFNGTGIWNSNLNASGYALNTGAIVLASAQPNSQSCGDLDYQAYEVLYYSAGSIFRYSRTTGAFLGSYAITGTPVALTNLNSTTLMYTGCAGQEIALLDYVNKRIYLYNKATGAYAGMSQLPATAITSTSFKTSWANNYVWLFNLANLTWYSYQIFSIPLPIELLSFKGDCENGKVELKWSTASEINNDHFTIERSADGINYKAIGVVNAAGKSSKMQSYTFYDENAGAVDLYYRLKQTDHNGEFKYSEVISVKCADSKSEFNVYPNPNNGSFTLNGISSGDEVSIYNSYGSLVYRSINNTSDSNQFNIKGISSGVYLIQISSGSNIINKKLIVN